MIVISDMIHKAGRRHGRTCHRHDVRIRRPRHRIRQARGSEEGQATETPLGGRPLAAAKIGARGYRGPAASIVAPSIPPC